MGNSSSNEHLEDIVKSCLIDGIDGECIENARRLDDDGKIELYNNICDPDLPPPQYDSRGCRRYCSSFGREVQENCTRKVNERCDNYKVILGDLEDNFPECNIVGISDISSSQHLIDTGKPKGKGVSIISIFIVVIIILLGIYFLYSLNDHRNTRILEQ